MLTLFPSPKTEEGIKGGVVLLRMQPPPGTTLATAPPLKLSAAYTDRCVRGAPGARASTQLITLPATLPLTWQSSS